MTTSTMMTMRTTVPSPMYMLRPLVAGSVGTALLCCFCTRRSDGEPSSRPPRRLMDHVEVTDEGAQVGAEVGIGPHPQPWPRDARLDPELLANGDRRNVVDRYRYWRHEAIVADLDGMRHPFHVAIENFQHDFNIGAVVRNANAFLASEVHIVGKRR